MSKQAKGCQREGSTSITHLVKIVASEVVDSRIQELRDFVTKVARSVCKDELDRLGLRDSQAVCVNVSNKIDELRNALARCGERWTEDEDQMLEREMAAAFEQIAANHSRTVAAIKARIRDRQLLYSK